MAAEQLVKRDHDDSTPAPASTGHPLPGLAHLLAPHPVDGKVQLSSDPATLLEQAKRMNLGQVAGKIHGRIYDADQMMTGESGLMGEVYLAAVLRGMAARDPVEEMLIIQMTLCHQRVVRLSLKASEQVHRQNVAVVNHALDQAMNAFRRAMLALKEYRSPPPRATKVFAPIRNSNVAGRQVVQVNQNGNTEEQDPPIEQGSATACLSAVAGGPGVPAGVGRAEPPVASEHRAADAGRQGAVAAELDEARRVRRRAGRRAQGVGCDVPAVAAART